jgi:hypothetical protein
VIAVVYANRDACFLGPWSRDSCRWRKDGSRQYK